MAYYSKQVFSFRDGEQEVKLEGYFDDQENRFKFDITTRDDEYRQVVQNIRFCDLIRFMKQAAKLETVNPKIRTNKFKR